MTEHEEILKLHERITQLSKQLDAKVVVLREFDQSIQARDRRIEELEEEIGE